MKIVIVGIGYVGLANAVLLAQHNSVILTDIVSDKIDTVNKGESPICDPDVEGFLSEKSLDLRAVQSSPDVYKEADYIVVATPTDYNIETGSFDTKTVETVIEDATKINPDALIIIKSTIPIGFTDRMKKKVNSENIIFSPEFLREGSALHDNLYPSRIVIGGQSDKAKQYANLVRKSILKKDAPVLFTGSTEAEAIKLFSNAYLANRVAFFNELDTFAEINKLSSKDIIDGVCLDSRILNTYNNPSFGYGGYCLPKDTKQLLSNYVGIPQKIISAIVEANTLRKEHIIDMIVNRNPNTVGIYRLIMKKDSDNLRKSSTMEIASGLKTRGINVLVYEPIINENDLSEFNIVNDLGEFKHLSDLIITNRLDRELNDVKGKIYTRDLYCNN